MYQSTTYEQLVVLAKSAVQTVRNFTQLIRVICVSVL